MECDKLIALPPAANQSSVARIAEPLFLPPEDRL